MAKNENSTTPTQSLKVAALKNAIERTRSTISSKENELIRLRDKESRAIKSLARLEINSFAKVAIKLQKSLPQGTGFSISDMGKIAALAARAGMSAVDLESIILQRRSESLPVSDGESPPDRAGICPHDAPGPATQAVLSKGKVKKNNEDSDG